MRVRERKIERRKMERERNRGTVNIKKTRAGEGEIERNRALKRESDRKERNSQKRELQTIKHNRSSQPNHCRSKGNEDGNLGPHASCNL